MKDKVVIKSSRSGLTVYLDTDCTFEELLESIERKFRESSRFWGNAQMALTLEGRKMTPEEEFRVVRAITENSSVEILCLVDNDPERIKRCEKALNQRLMELSHRTGQFYRGSLTRGESLDSEASIVVIGDVLPGARVTAKGNIIVLGELKGTAHAGIAGNGETVIVALDMAPTQLKIAASSQMYGEKGKKLGKGPVIASLVNDRIYTRPLKKSFLNLINFN